MNVLNEQPVDIERLLRKTQMVQAKPGQDPLKLIKTITGQFRTHFQEVKCDLADKVEKSAREMQRYQNTKRSLKQQDREDGYNIPTIPIQVYNWKQQQLESSPMKSRELKTKSTRAPPEEFPQQKYDAGRKTVTFKEPSQMDKFIYSKRFQKYIEDKNHNGALKQPKVDSPNRHYEMKQDTNVLVMHDYDDLQTSSFKQAKSILLDNRSLHSNDQVLKFVKKYQYDYRQKAFKNIMDVGKASDSEITKDAAVRYLFDHAVMMMLYSINPYGLVEEIANFATENPNQLNFVELTNFLLTPRQPPTADTYEQTQISKAEMSSFRDGKVTEPIVPYISWLDSDDIIRQLLSVFEYVDVFGRRKVLTDELIPKLKKFATAKGMLGREIVVITDIEKPICVQRFIYEIQFQHPRRREWTYNEYKLYLYDYRMLNTLPREQVIQSQMIQGSLEWTLLVGASVLSALRQSFDSCQKHSLNYVNKLQFLNTAYSNSNFQKIKHMSVRRAPFMDVDLETVEETLARIYYEGDDFLGIDQIVDFFTNRGRPFIINERIRSRNTEMQVLKIDLEDIARANQDTRDSDDQDIEYSILRQERKRSEFKSRIARTNIIKQKMKKITVPVPFDFNESKEETIRQRKLKEMLQEKEVRIQQEMQPMPKAKDVPWFVKENLYQRNIMAQESLRRRRLETFRTQIQSQMRPPPEHLLKPLQRGEVQEDSGKQGYQFVSRPMPWYCQIELLDRINNQKQDRRVRIKRQIEQRQEGDGTPQGIKNMMERQRVLKKKWQLKNKDKYSKSADKVHQIKIKPVPDFQKIFQENGIELQVKQRKPKKQPVVETWEEHHKKRIALKDEQVPAPPPAKSTQKFDALVQLRRNQRLEQLMKKEQEEEEDRIRHLAQKKLAPRVKQVVRRMQKEHQAQLQHLRRQTDPKGEEDQRKAWYQQTMYKVYQKVINRPLLLETLNNPRESDKDSIQELPQERIPQPKKLRERPIKKVLKRQDEPRNNLQRMKIPDHQEYDDDNFDDPEEQEQESEQYKQYQQKFSPEDEYLQKHKQMYQFQHHMLDQQYEAQEQDMDIEKYNNGLNNSF